MEIWASINELAREQPMTAIFFVILLFTIPRVMEFFLNNRRLDLTERDRVFEIILKTSNEFSERIKKLEIDNETCQRNYSDLLEEYGDLKSRYTSLENEVHSLRGGVKP